MAFRDISVGKDTLAYYNIFNHISNLEFSYLLSSGYSENIERGFALFIKLVSLIVDNYYFFQIIISALFCFSMGKFIYDNSPNMYLSSIIFLGCGLYLQAFTISRQCLAIAFIALAWSELKKNNYLKSLLYFLLGSIFHMSSIIFVTFVFVWLLKNKTKLLRAIPLFVLLIAINFGFLIDVLGFLLPRYKVYFANNLETIDIGGILVVWIFILCVALYHLYKRKSYSDNLENSECVLSIGYVSLNILGYFYNYVDRLGMYFAPCILIMIPVFIKSLNKSFTKKVLYIVTTAMFVALFYDTIFEVEYLKYSLFFLSK